MRSSDVFVATLGAGRGPGRRFSNLAQARDQIIDSLQTLTDWIV